MDSTATPAPTTPATTAATASITILGLRARRGCVAQGGLLHREIFGGPDVFGLATAFDRLGTAHVGPLAATAIAIATAFGTALAAGFARLIAASAARLVATATISARFPFPTSFGSRLATFRPRLTIPSRLATFRPRLTITTRLATFHPRPAIAPWLALTSRLAAGTNLAATAAPLAFSATAAGRALAAVRTGLGLRRLAAARIVTTSASPVFASATPAALAVAAASAFATPAGIRLRGRAARTGNDANLEGPGAEPEESARAFLEHGDHCFRPAEAELFQTFTYRFVESLPDEDRALWPHRHSPGLRGACVP